MNWIVIAITCGVLNAVASQGLKHEPDEPEYQSGFRLTFYSLCALLTFTLSLLLGFDWGSWQFVIVSLSAGLFSFINVLFILKAIKIGPLAVLWVIVWLAGPLAGIAWLIFPGTDAFSYYHGFGILFFLISLVSLTRAVKQQEGEKNKSGTKFLFYSFIACMGGMGAGYLIKLSSSFGTFQKGSPYVFAFLWNFMLLSCLTVNSFLTTDSFRIKRKSIPWALLGGVAISIELSLMQFGSGFGPALEFFSLIAIAALISAAVFARILQKELITFATGIGILTGITSIIFFSM